MASSPSQLSRVLQPQKPMTRGATTKVHLPTQGNSKPMARSSWKLRVHVRRLLLPPKVCQARVSFACLPVSAALGSHNVRDRKYMKQNAMSEPELENWSLPELSLQTNF